MKPAVLHDSMQLPSFIIVAFTLSTEAVKKIAVLVHMSVELKAFR